MRIEVKVPQLPESVAEATLVNWHKKPGEAVKRDENLIDIETDKVVLELPAPATACWSRSRRADGSTVTSQRRDRRDRHRRQGRRGAPRRRSAPLRRGALPQPRASAPPRKPPQRRPPERDRAARGAQDDGRPGRRPRPTVDGHRPRRAHHQGRRVAQAVSRARTARRAPAAPAAGRQRAGRRSRAGPVPSQCEPRRAARAARADVAAARSASPSASCSRSRPPRSSRRSTKSTCSR